jgi:hypothetical protein
MSRPQSNEIRRSERGRLEQESWRRKQEAERRPKRKAQPGPVPEENRSGHHPAREQDRPEE